MAIEAITAVAAKEVVAAKAVETAQQQLIQKLTTGAMEQPGVSQSVEQAYAPNNFRVGEISSPEIENKEIFKQREANAADEIIAKMDSAENDAPFRDTGADCLTSYEERIQQTPRDGWDGQRGESVCTKKLDSIGEVRVDYKNGIPDFTPYSKANVEIPNMTAERYGSGGNFEQADNALAEQWNQAGKDSRHDWTGAEVRDWRRENLSEYTWHECTDRKTCQLIPREINGQFAHLGGVGECNKFESLKVGHSGGAEGYNGFETIESSHSYRDDLIEGLLDGFDFD